MPLLASPLLVEVGFVFLSPPQPIRHENDSTDASALTCRPSAPVPDCSRPFGDCSSPHDSPVVAIASPTRWSFPLVFLRCEDLAAPENNVRVNVINRDETALGQDRALDNRATGWLSQRKHHCREERRLDDFRYAGRICSGG
ncbi:unnamed protein product [Scytosiphon promiscuus]